MVASDRNPPQTSLGRMKKLLEKFQNKRCLDQTMGKADIAGLHRSKLYQNVPLAPSVSADGLLSWAKEQSCHRANQTMLSLVLSEFLRKRL